MSRSRKHIGLKTKLAAALAHIAGIPMEHAQNMSEEMVISLFNFDHVILHAHGGSDEFWNLTPLLIMAHREKTARIDTPRFAKGEQIRQEHLDFQRRLLVPGAKREPKRSRWPSRPFPKRNPKR